MVAVFGALFAFIFAMGLWRLTDHVLLVSRGEQATGEVVELKAVTWRPGHGTDSQMGSNRPEFHPVVVFTDSDGMARRVVTRAGSYPAAFGVGDKVEVIYPTGSPEQARLFWWIELWLEPAIFIILGLLPALLLLKPGSRLRR